MTLYRNIITALLVSVFILLPGTIKAEEPFDLFIVPTLDEQLDSWLKIPPRLQPTIHLVDRIYPNQPFSLRVLFRGYSLSALKNARITYDVQIFDPTGKPTGDQGNKLLGYNGPVKSSNYIIINQQLLRIYFDASYPFGNYDIQVTATDHQANKVIRKTAKITFAPFGLEGQFSSPDYFSYWLRNYFRQPDIAKATFGVLQFMENDLQWMQKNIRLLAFIDRLLDDNPWLWEHLTRTYREKPDMQAHIITLMEICNYRVAELTAGFSTEQKAWQEKVREFELPTMNNKPATPADVEARWGVFYATGHLQPVEDIVRLLKPFALAESMADSQTTGGLEQVAFWSLVDHGTDISLVANYCTYLLEHKELPPETRTQLRRALEIVQRSLEQQEQKASANDKKNPLSPSR